MAPLASVRLIAATWLVEVYVDPAHAVLIDLPFPSPGRLFDEDAGSPHDLRVDALSIDATPYESVLRALAIVKGTENAEAGFCFEGIEAHRRFGNAIDREPPTGEVETACDP